MNNGREDAAYPLNDPENILYSACLNCNTGCGIKAKIQDGVLVKIDGNPYNPWTMVPQLPMDTPVEQAARIDAALCPKGQAGLQNAYDPYRIRKVLKRAGKRGENRWISIPFEQAIKEIVEGGKLFAHVPGEENREVEGFRSVLALQDPDVAKRMAEDVKRIWKAKDERQKKRLVEAFKRKHKDHLHVLIDPDHPDLGPKNNQFVFTYGRMKKGRSDWVSRFMAATGSTNKHGHTTVCQGSLYFTCKAIGEKFQVQDGRASFGGGKKMYFQGDDAHAKYILYVGANLFEANYGPTNRAVRLTENLMSGNCRIAVADPRFSKLASKAEVYLPVKPGEDSALAMAMIRRLFEKESYRRSFLKSANKAAALQNGETSWTNATWLVEIKDGKPGKFLRASEAGIGSAAEMVVMHQGRPVAFDPNSETHAVEGDLLVDATVGGVRVKSSLQLLKEESEKKGFEEWCEIAGCRPRDVARVADNLAANAPHSVVDLHRGPAQHTNGFYNVLSWFSLNMLLGNFDHKGGLVAASTYSYSGKPVKDKRTGKKRPSGPFDLTVTPGKISAFGISIIRHGVEYEKTTLFEGYPARRNWYPLSSDVYQEVIASAGEAYPYPVKILMTYMHGGAYSLPAAHSVIEHLADTKKIPLHIASDILIGSTSMYADYIFPDGSYFERWEFHGSHPNIPQKVQPIRQPVIPPVPETVKVYGEEMPLSLEAIFLGVAERMKMKAFGNDAFGKGLHLKRPEDYYLRAVANMATGAKPADSVPDADAREEEIFIRSRRHLPKSVYDTEKWKSIVGRHWKKVVYLLNRGGRFQKYEESFDGDMLKNRFAGLLNLYQEKTYSKKYSATGEHYSGIATYIPQRNYLQESLDELSDGYDLHMITHRTISMTKSRTIGNYWLRPLMQENGFLLNPVDAKRLKLKTGDLVKVVSATNKDGEWDLKGGRKKPMIGKVKVTETIRPGVTSFELGFGHWATGSTDVYVDNQRIKGDRRREAGVHANAAMWTDPSLRNTSCMVDPVGGSVSFYDTKVRLVKV